MSLNPVPAESPRQLFERVLLNPGDQTLLAELKSRSTEIISMLDREDPSLEDLTKICDLDNERNAEWLLEVIGTFADDGVFEEDCISEPVHDKEDLQIGLAFSKLVETLPGRLKQIENWLSAVSPLAAEHIEFLKSKPDVQAAPFSEELLAKGVTPLTAFMAFQALDTLVTRAARLGSFGPENALILEVENGTLRAAPDPAFAVALTHEVSDMAECPLDVATGLTTWMVEVLTHDPKLTEWTKTDGESKLKLDVSREGGGIKVAPCADM